MPSSPDVILAALRALSTFTEEGDGVDMTFAVDLAHPSWADGALLVLSAENGNPYLDYYNEWGFSFTNRRDALLAEHGVYLEWINAGVAALYDKEW